MRRFARPIVRVCAVLVGISSDRFDRLWDRLAKMSRAERVSFLKQAIDAVLAQMDQQDTSHEPHLP